MTTDQQRVAVVTGAARGIGAGVARRLAADGMAVAVLDLDESACGPLVEEITAAGGRALAVGADVSDEEQVAAAVQRIVDELGPPTVLVNNASVFEDDRIGELTRDSWDLHLDTNLRAPIVLAEGPYPTSCTRGSATACNWPRPTGNTAMTPAATNGSRRLASAISC